MLLRIMEEDKQYELCDMLGLSGLRISGLGSILIHMREAYNFYERTLRE